MSEFHYLLSVFVDINEIKENHEFLGVVTTCPFGNHQCLICFNILYEKTHQVSPSFIWLKTNFTKLPNKTIGYRQYLLQKMGCPNNSYSIFSK